MNKFKQTPPFCCQIGCDNINDCTIVVEIRQGREGLHMLENVKKNLEYALELEFEKEEKEEKISQY